MYSWILNCTSTLLVVNYSKYIPTLNPCFLNKYKAFEVVKYIKAKLAHIMYNTTDIIKLLIWLDMTGILQLICMYMILQNYCFFQWMKDLDIPYVARAKSTFQSFC